MAPQPTDTDFRQNDRRQDYGLKVWHRMKYTDVKQAKAFAAYNTTASLIPTEHAQGCIRCVFVPGFHARSVFIFARGEMKATFVVARASSACRYPSLVV